MGTATCPSITSRSVCKEKEEAVEDLIHFADAKNSIDLRVAAAQVLRMGERSRGSVVRMEWVSRGVMETGHADGAHAHVPRRCNVSCSDNNNKKKGKRIVRISAMDRQDRPQ